MIRIVTETDLRMLANKRDVYYVQYKVYAGTEKPDWGADIVNGPIFPMDVS